MAEDEMMSALGAADPIRESDVDVSDQRLQRVHDLLIERAFEPSPMSTPGAQGHRRSPRVRILALAASVVMLTSVGMFGLTTAGRGPGSIEPAIAVDGSGHLVCTTPGGAETTRSGAGQVPGVIPGWLPEGWEIEDVSERTEATSTCYGAPSLVIADVAGDGLVKRSAMVFGPIPGKFSVQRAGSGQMVDVAGRSGLLYRSADPKGEDELHVIWSDRQGRHWQLRTYGSSPEQTQRLAAALIHNGDQIDIDQALAPHSSVVFRRGSGPYPPWSTQVVREVLLHPVRVDGQHGDVALRIAFSDPSMFGADGVFPGDVLSADASGEPVVRWIEGELVRGLVLPGGVLASLSIPPGRTTPSLGDMPAADWARVLESIPGISAGSLARNDVGHE